MLLPMSRGSDTRWSFARLIENGRQANNAHPAARLPASLFICQWIFNYSYIKCIFDRYVRFILCDRYVSLVLIFKYLKWMFFIYCYIKLMFSDSYISQVNSLQHATFYFLFTAMSSGYLIPRR